MRKRHRPGDQIIVVTPITVSMKIGIVFIELHVRAAELLISAIGRPLHDALPCPVLRHEIL